MEYQNPKIPEGINVSKEHVLKNFIILLLTVVGVLAIVLAILSFSVGELVKFIPFETEVSLAGKIANAIEKPDSEYDERHRQTAEYLQKLTDKLSLAQDLPENMQITVHYIDEPVVNAFATLGGHIIVYQGIINTLSSENALAMVLSHEIAHVKHRHPISAIGRSASIALVLSLAGLDDSGFTSGIGGHMSLFTALAFSRSQETEADTAAFETLISYYGHGQGATEFFTTLKASETQSSQPEFLQSHPLKEKRIKRLKELEASSYTTCSKSAVRCALSSLPGYIKVGGT